MNHEHLIKMNMKPGYLSSLFMGCAALADCFFYFLLVQKVNKKDPANGHPTLADCTLI
jgi:hypothetical protein